VQLVSRINKHPVPLGLTTKINNIAFNQEYFALSNMPWQLAVACPRADFMMKAPLFSIDS